MNSFQSMAFQNNTISTSFLRFGMLLVFLKSMRAWFMWDLHLVIVGAIGVVCLLIFITRYPSSLNLTKWNLIAIILFASVELYSAKSSNMNGVINAIIIIIFISIFILFRNEIKVDLLLFLTRAMAIIVFISLCAWMVFLIGISLPYFKTDFNHGQYLFNNYFLFLNIPNSYYAVPRFSSIFLEPGHFGMIASFLLFANKFELKRKEVFILLIGALFTLSLAAYLLVLVSATSFVLVQSKRPIIYLMLWSGILIGSFLVASTYNNGDNYINTLIIKRLEYKDGDIKGNNRVTKYMDDYFNRFINGNNKLLGIGTKKYGELSWGNGGNAGYKVFIIQHGIIGTLLLFLFYLSLVIPFKSKLTSVFLILYILSFLQRAYALWEVELLIFIIAMPFLFLNQKTNFNAK